MAGGDRLSGIASLLATGLIGAGAGLLTGGRAIKTYDWRTEWFVPAPLPAVYDAMTSRSALRQWWPSMEFLIVQSVGKVLSQKKFAEDFYLSFAFRLQAHPPLAHLPTGVR